LDLDQVSTEAGKSLSFYHGYLDIREARLFVQDELPFCAKAHYPK